MCSRLESWSCRSFKSFARRSSARGRSTICWPNDEGLNGWADASVGRMKGSCWALCGFWGSCPHSGMGLSRPTPCRMPRRDVADVACALIFPPRVQELSTKDTHHQTSHRMPRRWNDFGAVLGICFRLCYCWQSMLMTMAWSWHRMRCNAWHMRIRRQMATELWSLEWFEVFSWYSMTSIGALSIYSFP